MKWNILVGSLVLGLGLSTQSFGMDLLDRMLGMDYNGCCDTASCCETNCVDPGPSCGCETGCDAVRTVRKKCRKTPLLDLLRGCVQEEELLRHAVAKLRCGCEAAGLRLRSRVIPVVVARRLVILACGCEDPCAGLVRARRRSAVAHCWTFCEVAAEEELLRQRL